MPNATQYVSKKEVAASYRPKSYQMSPGLLRARAPFRARNAITGVAIAALVVGVWAYSIAAVKQDSFADVDEEARILASSGSMQNVRSIEDEEKAKVATITPVHTPSTSIGTSPTQPQPLVTATHVVTPLPGLVPRPKGLLAPLLDRLHPRILDPTSKTLVWGAPSVDRIGRLRD
ncbi:hypothetical protein BDM02DRAFT_1873740 [Thelephora ganbajun]|uniref:Uncharacterized protein n=1 Tax=Thelephora ganbajun TaxID=370292 RepID=A0ACB6ZIT7_THEGA|nr:hypothetical protein BDM02DRAFT_1873740 [Thelephora ganbajun]